MNGQILTNLMGQSYTEEGKFSPQKFAELIVKECAEHIDFAIFSNGGIDGRSLKEHFGVEE